MNKFINILFLYVLIHNANLMDVSYYEILGVSKEASPYEIKQAFKKLAVKYHPDKNTKEAEQEKFIKITEAYETLKDRERRKIYDSYGSHRAYTRQYGHQSQSENINKFYNGLYHKDPHVVTYTNANFFAHLIDGYHFINFYSPFCPPCQNLADHWKRFAKTYKGIIKVGAVNCKYHNLFCYHFMKIDSYPTLIFYPDGQKGGTVYYRGGHTFYALEEFVMYYLKNEIHVPILSQLRSTDTRIAYVLESNSILDYALTRIAFRLKDLVTVALVEDEELCIELSSDPDTIVVFKYKEINIEIMSSDENTIIKKIIETFPKVKEISPENFKNIRTKLRSGSKKPYVLYFPSADDDKLLLQKMKIKYPNMNFGTIDCESQQEMCMSLQVESTPSWAVLKRGAGAYQRIGKMAPEVFIPSAAEARNLHTLSASELRHILAGDDGFWVLLLVPYETSWDHIEGPFTEAGKHFVDSDELRFGIMECTLKTEQYCQQLGYTEPVILTLDGKNQHRYVGRIDTEEIIKFIESRKVSGSVKLSEQDLMDITDSWKRKHIWLVAYLPADCGPECDEIAREWDIVAERLRPLDAPSLTSRQVRVGLIRCGPTSEACYNVNVLVPTARLSFPNSKLHYKLDLQQTSTAPYMVVWALEYIEESVEKLTWHTFFKTVAAEDIDPHIYKLPWLVYFFSPECHHCYDQYPDFSIVSILLSKVVNFGTVNCKTERNLCHHESIIAYPTLKMYLKNYHEGYRVVTLKIRDHEAIMDQISPYLPTVQHAERMLRGELHTNPKLQLHTYFKHDEL